MTAPGTGRFIRSAMLQLCSICQGAFPEGTARCPEDNAPLSGQRTGEVLADYWRLERLVHVGGSGAAIWKASIIEGGGYQAVKILPDTRTGLAHRLARGVRLASRLDHPNIANVYAHGQIDDETCFVVMDLLDGCTLAEVLLSTGPLPARRVARIGEMLLQALEAAHASGVVHGNLRSDNVLLVSRDGDPDFVKVLDFGLGGPGAARAGSERPASGWSLTDTSVYMAPEAAAGLPLDGRADVYGVAAILFELLLGHAPGLDWQVSADGNRRHPLSSNGGVTGIQRIMVDWPELGAVVSRGLAADMNARYPTARMMRQALNTAMDAPVVPEILSEHPVTTLEAWSEIAGHERTLLQDLMGNGDAQQPPPLPFRVRRSVKVAVRSMRVAAILFMGIGAGWTTGVLTGQGAQSDLLSQPRLAVERLVPALEPAAHAATVPTRSGAVQARGGLPVPPMVGGSATWSTSPRSPEPWRLGGASEPLASAPESGVPGPR